MKLTDRKHAVILLLLGALTAPSGIAKAQEHPEHPKAKEQKASLTMEQLAQAITEYVTEDTKAKGGYFLVFDPVAKKPLALTLELVHQDRLSSLGGGVYFACADFKSIEGSTYDIDVFMKDGDDGLKTTEVHVHKVDGKPRYTWKEQEGVWVREKAK